MIRTLTPTATETAYSYFARTLAFLLAAVALIGCASPPPHHAERPRLLCAIYLYRYPSLSVPSKSTWLQYDNVSVVGHTRAPGCAEAAEDARRTYLIEEEIR